MLCLVDEFFYIFSAGIFCLVVIICEQRKNAEGQNYTDPEAPKHPYQGTFLFLFHWCIPPSIEWYHVREVSIVSLLPAALSVVFPALLCMGVIHLFEYLRCGPLHGIIIHIRKERLMERLSFGLAKLIRVLSATHDSRNLTIQHDYGSQVIPWDTITHLFGARLKRLEHVSCLLISIQSNEALFYVEGTSFNFKSFLRNEVTNKRDVNFNLFARKCIDLAVNAYIDWPLRDSIKGGSSLLPEFTDQNKLNDYCQKGRLQAPEKKPEKVDAPLEDSLAAVFSRKHEIFLSRRKSALRYLSRSQGLLSRAREEENRVSSPDSAIGKAIEELENSLKADPCLFQSHVVLGELYQRLNQVTHALEYFTRAVDLDPLFEGNAEMGRVILTRGIAKLHSVKGNNEGMQWALNQYAGLFPKGRDAVQCADIISRMDGIDSPWFRDYHNGHCLLEQADFEGALRHFNSAIAAFSRFRWNFHWKGVALAGLGSHEEALAAFMAGNNIHYDALTDIEISATLEKLGRIEEAEDVLTRILAILPHFYLPHLVLAKLLFHHRKNEKESFEHLLKAIEIRPDGNFQREAAGLVNEISDEQIRRRDRPIEERKEWVKGELIDTRYEVQKVFKGGMGIVYIVIDRKQSRLYAIKSFQDQFLWDDKIIKMFINEAEVWVKLGAHKNIVRAEQVKNFDGKPYIFLEFINGSDLEQRIAQGALDILTATEYALQFCEGMNYAFKTMGVVHRDIKPSNCLITEDEVLKITDFGLVKIFTGESPDGPPGADRFSLSRGKMQGDDMKTSTSGVGSFPYMSPEQFLHQDQITTRSDIYSFGAMLFEMLIGTPPFGNESMDECVSGHLYETPPDPCSLNPDIPRELGDIILRCLNKAQVDRFADFEELLHALNAFYERLTGISFIVSTSSGEITADEITRKGESLLTLGRFSEALEIFNEGLKLNKDSTRLMVDKAECLYRMGRLQDAFNLLDQALALEPQKPEIWYHRGNIYSSAKKFQEALQCYDRALHFNPHMAEVWSRKGAMFDLMGNSRDALKCHDKAIKINPRLSEAWNNKGNLLTRLDRVTESIECYSKAIEINPRYVMAWYNKGLLHQKLNEHSEAISSFSRVNELDARFVNAWMASGSSYFKLNQTDMALQCFNKALAIEPRNFKLWLFKGNCLYEMGRLEEAASCFGNALKINDQNIQAWISRGVVMGELFYLDEAVECYDRALQLNPTNEFVLKAFFRLKQKKSRIALSMRKDRDQGSYHRMQDEALMVTFDSYDKLVQHHSCLLEIFPDDPVVWYRKGLLLSIMGNESEASSCFEKAVTLDPLFERPGLKDERTYFTLHEKEKATRKKGLIGRLVGKEKPPFMYLFEEGMEHYDRGDYVQAVRCFEQGLRSHSEYVEGWWYGAQALFRLSYFERALESITRGLARSPLDVSFWTLKGTILQRMGRAGEAMEAFEIAFKIQPSQMQGWLHAILCLEGVSQSSLAREYAIKALYYLERSHTRGEETIEYYRSTGILLAVLERYENARQYYKEALKYDQGDFMSWTLTGDALYRLGHPEEALDCFARAEESEPRNSPTLLRKALCYNELSMTGEAVATLSGVTKSDPAFEWAWYYQGIILAESGDREEALHFFNEAMESVPGSSLLWASRGVFLYRQGKFKDSLWCCDKALELNSQDVNFWMNKGILLNKLASPRDAVHCFERILEVENENVRAWYFRGISLFLLRDWEGTIECCNKVTEINPRVVDAWILKGVSLFRVQKLQDALYCLDRGIELDPERADIWNNRGVLWRKLERLEEAIKSYNKALEVDPRCALAWFNKGRWFAELNRLEEALECYDRDIEVNTRNPIAWREKGHCHYELGRFAEALRCYERSIKFDPSSWETLCSKGLALYRMERPEESLSSYEKAIESEQNSVDLWNNTGLVLLKLNRRNEALNAFEQAIKLDPECEVALYNKALVLQKLNFRKSAEETLRRLMEINPDFSMAHASGEGFVSHISPIKKNAGVHLMMEFKLDYELSVKKLPHCFMS